MRYAARLLAAFLLAVPAPVLAWGYEGHEIVADIARAHLTPAVRAKVDAILATDVSDLTKHDMASEATWADAWRGAGHRETAQWHFVDAELDGSADQDAACFGRPAAATPASAGPAQDCVVDKINQFAAELKAPGTAPAERLLALKYLLHFVGDVHQPLHASDNHDHGGNCTNILLGPTRTANLHSLWDTVLVRGIDEDADRAAAKLDAQITAAQVTIWQRGTPAQWAGESFALARSAAYSIRTPAGCDAGASPVELPDDYQAKALPIVSLQLARAGVRLAGVLNDALAVVPVGSAALPAAGKPNSTAAPLPAATIQQRTPESLACSADADAKGLHGKDRQRFRRACMHERRAG